jgi:predicted NBD/HSP70 family sugar kinase
MPPLDPDFIPLAKLFNEYDGTFKAGIAVERLGEISCVVFNMQNSARPTDTDKEMALLLLKSMLWVYGGHKVIIGGSEGLAAYIGGLRDTTLKFDWDFMAGVYERPFEVVSVPFEDLPEATARSGKAAEHNMNGCRLGFDAGGSDIKVSAVIDGEAVFSEEIVWHPKINSDPAYHYKFIVDAMKLAASKMPRVDGIGVSSAGIYVDNRTMVASLFIKVGKDDFDKHVKDIYIRAAAELGNPPMVVANDGDVTALAGAMEYGEGRILGIAMGTSEAGGYIDENGSITGWLNELAFVPVDANPAAMLDEWSGDRGRGVKYFSQDAVIKLAPAAGIEIPADLSPAEKLKIVQELMAAGDKRAALIYESIGCYLGYSLAWYSMFYYFKRVLLMGRVVSGQGGAIILEKAKEVLKDEYPSLYSVLELHLPDEKSRRVGQSVAAASLPVIN